MQYMIREVYDRLPEVLKPGAKRAYNWVAGSDSSTVQQEFINSFFTDMSDFDDYSTEFNRLVADIQSKRTDEFYNIVPDSQATFGGLGVKRAHCLYAIIRSERPDTVVETGVCNGVSTLVILMAMKENNMGELYSIDYPTFSDDPVPDFQEKQYPDDHTFSAIPKGKSPGWIIPKNLRGRWELRTGKSQQELPPLLSELEEIDIFIHDSDHTFPCMMFEYELAWEFLRSGGLLLSDDIHANAAFDVFGETRAEQYGEAVSGFGYAVK